VTTRRRRGSGEEGTVVLWLLGLCMVLLLLGGLSLDLWRVLGERRALAGLADSAAIAGATAIDEGAFRTSGAVRLDTDLARRRALESIAAQVRPATLTGADAVATADAVTVVVEGRVPLTLLRLVAPQGGIDVSVRAVSGPHRG
jgi:Flp pilus assembly protein TadG